MRRDDPALGEVHPAFDADFIARHDRGVPRYTSYPTAPHFTDAVDADTYATWLVQTPPGTPASLYLHVPFCQELCLYCGCNTAVARRYTPVADYLERLTEEITRIALLLPAATPVHHIHWGGGTPTILTGSDFRRVMGQLRRLFAVGSDAEIAVEIDPRVVTPAHVGALAEGGVNRASLGVQSFDPQVQATIRRRQSLAQTRRVVEWLRTCGVEALNLDLMYGLPHQTVANVLDSVEKALDLAPERIALFGYAHVPWMKKHQALMPAESLPDAAARLAQMQAAADRIAAAGYVRIGLDHFARPDDPMALAQEQGTLHRNFQGYTVDDAPLLIGFGASAISRLPQGYVQNATNAADYRKRLAWDGLATVRGLALTAEDRLRAELIERLMCDMAVDVAAICARHGAAPESLAGAMETVDALARDGIARRDNWRIVIPETARPLLRTLCAAFDAHLSEHPARHARAL